MVEAVLLAVSLGTVGGPVVGVAGAVTLFVLTTLRTDINQSKGARADERARRQLRDRAALLLALGTILLTLALAVAIPAGITLVRGETPATERLVVLGAAVVGLVLWPFALGNVRRAEAQLRTHRRRVRLR